jgi:hypothetical protein
LIRRDGPIGIGWFQITTIEKPPTLEAKQHRFPPTLVIIPLHLPRIKSGTSQPLHRSPVEAKKRGQESIGGSRGPTGKRKDLEKMGNYLQKILHDEGGGKLAVLEA